MIRSLSSSPANVAFSSLEHRGKHQVSVGLDIPLTGPPEP